MFAAHALDVGGRLREQNELAIRCRALGPLLACAAARGRAGARGWSTTATCASSARCSSAGCRGSRPVHRPWGRGARWHSSATGRSTSPSSRCARAWTARGRGRGAVGARTPATAGRSRGERGRGRAERPLGIPSRAARARSDRATTRRQRRPTAMRRATPRRRCLTASGELRVPGVARWWPHTHGEPALHDVRLVVHFGGGDDRQTTIDGGRVGFRDLAFGAGARPRRRAGRPGPARERRPGLCPRGRLDPDRPDRAGAVGRRSCARNWCACATPA